MARARKTLGIDREIVEKIKIISKNRGMSVAEYIRRLLNSAILLEESGLFAPKILDDARYEHILSSFRFILFPQDLLINKDFSKEDYMKAREYGEKIGRTFHEMLIDAQPFIEKLGESAGILIKRSNDLVVMKTDDFRRIIAEMIAGVARGNGYKISETEQIITIDLNKKSSSY
jgi:hypothetical protein